MITATSPSRTFRRDCDARNAPGYCRPPAGIAGRPQKTVCFRDGIACPDAEMLTEPVKWDRLLSSRLPGRCQCKLAANLIIRVGKGAQ